jgi:hypothetical protein
MLHTIMNPLRDVGNKSQHLLVLFRITMVCL